MTNEIRHANEDLGLAFKYVLRLLTVEEARSFESHFACCEVCAEQLAEITRFFELLGKSLGAEQALQSSKEKAAESASRTIGEFLGATSFDDGDRLIELFVKCFAGYSKLRKNIASRLGPKVEQAQIDRAAIEILLALPNYVSKIDDA